MFLVFLINTTVNAQKELPEQSRPFENIIRAFKSDSVQSFINSFSTEIKNPDTPVSEWQNRMREDKQ